MRIFVALAASLFAIAALAEPYRWVDAAGHVQYSDTPPAGVHAEPVKGHLSSISGPSAAQAQSAAQQEQAFQKRALAEQHREQLAARDAADHERACGAARSRLAAATNGRQVRFDPNGERHYLDEAEIASQVSQAQQDVQKYCN
jgi:Domain of unknown function (DUF4124)